MAEYIEREAAVYALEYDAPEQVFYSRNDAADCICTLPAADVEPVRHGKWNKVVNSELPAYIHDKCSICGWLNTKNALCYDGGRRPGHSLNFCPNCGAKMDGSVEGGFMMGYQQSKDGYIVFEDGGVNPLAYGATEKWFQTYDQAISYAMSILSRRTKEFLSRVDANSVIVYEGSEDVLHQSHSVPGEGKVIFYWSNYYKH